MGSSVSAAWADRWRRACSMRATPCVCSIPIRGPQAAGGARRDRGSIARGGGIGGADRAHEPADARHRAFRGARQRRDRAWVERESARRSVDLGSGHGDHRRAGVNERGINSVDSPVSGGVAGAKPARSRSWCPARSTPSEVEPILKTFGSSSSPARSRGSRRPRSSRTTCWPRRRWSSRPKRWRWASRQASTPRCSLTSSTRAAGATAPPRTSFRDRSCRERSTSASRPACRTRTSACASTRRKRGRADGGRRRRRQMLAVTHAKFGADSDFTSIARFVEEWAGVEIKEQCQNVRRRTANMNESSMTSGFTRGHMQSISPWTRRRSSAGWRFANRSSARSSSRNPQRRPTTSTARCRNCDRVLLGRGLGPRGAVEEDAQHAQPRMLGALNRPHELKMHVKRRAPERRHARGDPRGLPAGRDLLRRARRRRLVPHRPRGVRGDRQEEGRTSGHDHDEETGHLCCLHRRLLLPSRRRRSPARTRRSNRQGSAHGVGRSRSAGVWPGTMVGVPLQRATNLASATS